MQYSRSLPNPGIALLVILGLSTSTAQAQQLALEEVVVSARKIEENSQTVPISMAVLTKRKIEDINAFDFTEIDRIAPSLQLGQNSPASATLKIRNVGPDFFALAFPPAVAVYVDGVPQTQPGSVFSTMLDIERIEVLNGPQGTLYGKNAPAGLLSIYTGTPHTDGFDGYVTSSYSSWGTWNNTMAVNVPLVKDKLAMRIAGMYSESDGYMDNAIPGADESNGKEHKGVRVKLLWTPSDDMEVLLAYYYADLTSEDNGTGYEGRVPDNNGDTRYESRYDDYEVFKGVPSFSKTEIEELVLNWTWSLEKVNLTLLGQYQDLNIFQQQDNSNFREVPPPGTPKDSLVFDPQSYSVEFRADGELGARFSYVGGLFYSSEKPDTVNSINSINIIGEAETESLGIFSNWTYEINDQWDTSLGMRYSDVDYTAQVFGFIPGLGELNTPFEENYSDPSYSFKLRYYPSQDVLVYFAIDTAFRAGGMNVLAPLAGELVDIFSFVGDNLQIIADDYFVFDQEDSISYEIGMKGSFLEQRLRWNVSAFIQYYDDHQYRTSPTDASVTPVLSGAFSNLIVNVEELEVYGFESEFEYLIDENWSIFTTAAYARPEIQEFSKRMCDEGEAAPGVMICPGESGERLNDEPDLHVFSQLRYQYRFVESKLEFFGLLTGEYYDEPYQRVSTPNIEDILIFDLTLGLRDVDDTWSVKVWSKNITDEMVIFSESIEEQTSFVPGQGLVAEFLGYSASPRAPRSFGITADYRF